MICLFYEIEDSNKYRVTSTHYNPELLSKDILAKGILVDNIPKQDSIKLKTAIHYINPQTKEQWYEYVDRAKTQEEIQNELNAKLLKDSANMQIELNKQKELNASLLLKVAQLGGNANV